MKKGIIVIAIASFPERDGGGLSQTEGSFYITMYSYRKEKASFAELVSHS